MTVIVDRDKIRRGSAEREDLVCIKIAARGDLLLASPAFERLRETRPAARVTLVVGASCADVARHLPYFDEIRTIDDWSLFARNPSLRLQGVWQLGQALGARRFSEAIIFHRDWRYAVLTRMIGIPVRRGFAGRRALRFLSHAYPAGEREHHVHQYLGLISAPPKEDLSSGMGAGVAPVPARARDDLSGTWRFANREREQAWAVAARYGFDPGHVNSVALGFGGGKNSKTRTDLKLWPLERYEILAAELDRRGCQVVWVGDKEDARLLGNSCVGVNLAGRLSVTETAGVVGACRAMVANDTFTMHLAQSLGVPTVAIFGPTDPETVKPLGAESVALWIGSARLPCSPCHQDGYFPPCPFAHRCMQGISVDVALDAVCGILEGSAAEGAWVGR